jgi:Na+-transporting NADH:ubiquinone oxidoreductase subunit D
VREVTRSGKLQGYTILNPVNEGGWYLGNGLMLMPPSAFFLIGVFIWVLRTFRPEQVEKEG